MQKPKLHKTQGGRGFTVEQPATSSRKRRMWGLLIASVLWEGEHLTRQQKRRYNFSELSNGCQGLSLGL